jgi:ribulose-phosphate 3-epimerase
MNKDIRTEIVPTITTNDPEAYKATVIRLNPFAKRVQIDVSDGEFTTNKLLDLSKVWWPAEWQTDIHMMVKRPSEHMAMLLKLKPSLVIFHAEAEEDLLPHFKALQEADIKAGVAFLKGTYPLHHANYLEVVDHAMIFSGELGHQGGHASLMQLEKVPLIRQVDPERGIEIGWDGGANVDNVFGLAHGGIDVINVGSAIASADDPEVAYKTLQDEIIKTGVIDVQANTNS